MRTIITTVGTSLLNNRDGRPWSKDPLPDPAVVAAWLQDADPRRASAELHTWFRLGLFEQPTHERVRLIHSHTPDGQFCAERLRDYAQRHRLDAALVDITELHYTDTATFNRGLRQLVHVLAEQIRAARAQGEVALAATGGFKAEIAVANLVGALLDTPVYYIYEQFEHLIKLEPLPIALQGDWLRQGPGEKLLQTLAAEEIVPGNRYIVYCKPIPALNCCWKRRKWVINCTSRPTCWVNSPCNCFKLRQSAGHLSARLHPWIKSSWKALLIIARRDGKRRLIK